MNMKEKGLLRSATLISGFTLLSRVLGFVRDMAIARNYADPEFGPRKLPGKPPERDSIDPQPV